MYMIEFLYVQMLSTSINKVFTYLFFFTYCKFFLVSLKPVSEPPVPGHVQCKEHVFKAFMLE